MAQQSRYSMREYMLAWLILLVLMGGLGWVIEQIWGNPKPDTGDCATRVPQKGEDQLKRLDCGDPKADFRVVFRAEFNLYSVYVHHTHPHPCDAYPQATEVFEMRTEGSNLAEAFCLADVR